MGGGVSRPVARGQKFMCCVRSPMNINVFVRVPGREESGSRPGGSVTGVTEKLFMCQMFMCLFRPLELSVCRPARELKTGKNLQKCSWECSQKSGCSQECARECSRGCSSCCSPQNGKEKDDDHDQEYPLRRRATDMVMVL